MAEPKQKSLEIPTFLTRHIPIWMQPNWLEAQRWRAVVAQQDVAGLCMSSLLSDIESSTWQVRAREPSEEDELAEDIEYYTDVLNPTMQGGLDGFDYWASSMGQDMLTIPAGGNTEIVRWPANMQPLSRPYDDKGGLHVSHLVFMDGATVFPTTDRQFPLAQKIEQDILNIVFFERSEFTRWVMQPRPEMTRWGYGMAPPERVFLAISLISRGDQYYANLLLDTPEAGLLDMMDMSKESAVEWIQGFKELFGGIDPFKIPIAYNHTKPWNFLAFNRPPTEMMFDTTTLKYAQVTTSGYGLTLSDIGLEPAGKSTLAGKIRDERKSRRSGYGVTREKIRNSINSDILPDYLEHIWIENDEETLVQRGRSFMLFMNSVDKAIKSNVITASEGQKLLITEGFLSEGVEEPEEPEIPSQLISGDDEEVQEELDKVPADEGGRGDITASTTIIESANNRAITSKGVLVKGGIHVIPNRTKEDSANVQELKKAAKNAVKNAVKKGDITAPLTNVGIGVDYPVREFSITEPNPLVKLGPSLGDETISAVPPTSTTFDQLALVFETAFDEMLTRMEPARIERLVKVATREMFPDVTQAFIEFSGELLSNNTVEEMHEWVNYWKKDRVIDLFDPDVTKADPVTLDAIGNSLNSDQWWKISTFIIPNIEIATQLAFSEGAEVAAQEVQRFLFTEGLRAEPNIVGLSFNLKNMATLAQLETNAARLVTQVNDGTKFFLQRAIAAGVDEGLSLPNIVQLIQDGASVEQVLSEQGFMSSVVRQSQIEITNLSRNRIASIVNTEIAKAETEGRVAEWEHMGLTQKEWVHTGSDTPCRFCQANIDRGFIEMTESFTGVFGAIQGPPAHPQVDHCHIGFNEDELIDKAGELEVWTGE